MEMLFVLVHEHNSTSLGFARDDKLFEGNINDDKRKRSFTQSRIFIHIYLLNPQHAGSLFTTLYNFALIV